MKILLQKKWKTNVGEEVLAKGARATLERAFPDAEIVENSGWMRKVVGMKEDGGLANFVRDAVGLSRSRKAFMRDNAADLLEFHDPDVVVIPGPSLHPAVYGAFGDVVGGETPTLLLGTGAPRYDEETIEKTRAMIRTVPVDAAIVRNERATAYEDVIDEFHVGIDNGFFIDDWYTPPVFDETLTAITYDKTPEPDDLPANGRVIRPHHTPFGMLYPDFLRRFFATGWSEAWYRDDHWFASDTLTDYLNVYGNAEVTYTDRLHACVPTLAYGNEAVFDLDTPRQGILDREFVTERDGRLAVDREALAERKSEQVDLVRDVIESIART